MIRYIFKALFAFSAYKVRQDVSDDFFSGNLDAQ